jgi:hypothetical protein
MTPLDLASISTITAEVNLYAATLGVSSPIASTDVHSILSEAYSYASNEFGMRAAVDWAAGYTFPPDLLAADLSAFTAAQFNLPSLCKQRHKAMHSSRFNLERMLSTFGPTGTLIPNLQPADFQRLCTVARDGIQIHLPDNFIPCATPLPLRTKYIRVACTVHKMLAAQLTQGTIMILPTHLLRTISGINFSCQHWTTNKGKPQGRNLCDVASPVNDIDIPLNGATPTTKQLLRDQITDQWDPIVHPTLTVLMRLILTAVAIHGWGGITLWKKDLQGAFTLLWFRPIDVCLLAFPLTHDLSVLHLAGMFGWVGMPYIFQVLTRALVALCLFYIVGLCLMYVDDIMGVSPLRSAAADMATVDTHVTGLLGPDAIAVSKNERNRALVWIGWFIDLDNRSVTLSRRNLLKTIYAFFCFTITDKITRIQVKTMASLASRCSQLCRPMRPYTKVLYDTIALYSDRHVRRTVPALAKVDVAVWRAFLLLSRFNPAQISRPIQSFADRPATLIFKYDASLITLAIGVYSCAYPGAPHTLLAFTSIDLAFPTTEARNQNTFEFHTPLSDAGHPPPVLHPTRRQHQLTRVEPARQS